MVCVSGLKLLIGVLAWNIMNLLVVLYLLWAYCYDTLLHDILYLIYNFISNPLMK
nr:hypothetical protein Itr_chr09CG19810 [Ipomoea trifida]